jgi:hypothetical protein
VADVGGASWPGVAFYRSVTQARCEPVLHVGCIAGQLVVVYLQRGSTPDTVDVSPEMLTIVRPKAAQRGYQLTLNPRLVDQAPGLLLGSFARTRQKKSALGKEEVTNCEAVTVWVTTVDEKVEEVLI